MTRILKAINSFYTEKGNVSVKTRAALKEVAVNELTERFPEIEVSEKGLRIPMVTNERGETVYAFIAVTISANTEVKEKAPKVKEVATVDIPNDIFE